MESLQNIVKLTVIKYFQRNSSPQNENYTLFRLCFVPNPYDFLSSVEYKRRYFEECTGHAFPDTVNWHWGCQLSF